MSSSKSNKILDVAAQLDDVRFGQRSSTSDKGLVFDVNLAGHNPAGRNPCCLVKDAKLGVMGRATDNHRGLKVIEYKLNGTNTSASFVKLGLAFNRTQHDDMYTLCRGVFDKWVEKHDPVRKSMWYQNHFPQLTDGTKVHVATRGLLSPETFVYTELEGNAQYDSPARTYGEFLFGNDVEGRPWYNEVRVSEGFAAKDGRPATEYMCCFFDEKGKQCTDKVEHDMTIYKKGGVPLMSGKMLKLLTESEFYKSAYWGCTVVLQLYSMEIRCGTVGEQGNCLYPIFNFRTTNSLCFQVRPQEILGDSGITFEQRDTLFSAAIFEGVNAPNKKRKRNSTRKGTTSNNNNKSTSPAVEELTDDKIESENTVPMISVEA